MAVPGSSLCCAPLPIFNGKDYNYWKTKMKTFFISQGLWHLIQNGITSKRSAAQRHQIYEEEEEERKNAQALYYVQLAVAPTIFPKISSAWSAKTAWDILDAEYNDQAKFLVLEEMDFHAIGISQDLETPWLKLCISEIPKNLRDVNPTAYTPRLISIGPLHHGRPELANMEKYKLYYAKYFLHRTGKQQDIFVHFIKQHEKSIRDSYSKHSELSSRDYVQMIILDSFFIFELFLRFADKLAGRYADDSLLHEQFFSKNIQLDLLLFENQLPYSLLSDLYEIAGLDHRTKIHPFTYFCLLYFKFFSGRYIWQPMGELRGELKDELHFTALLRRSLSRGMVLERFIASPRSFKFSAKILSDSKVKFSRTRDGILSQICFNKRVLELPRFTIDNTTERIYSNLIGFELCLFKNYAYICSYIWFLRMLIQTSDDVTVLVDAGVIINELDSNQAVVDMFNMLCKNVRLEHFHFLNICEELDNYCSSWSGRWNYWKRILNEVYFTNIWTSTGTIAAVVLLFLTLTQTITSILQVIPHER